jgi:hypothetical protein
MTRRIGNRRRAADLRTLTPLPDTADELCTVAKQLQLSPMTSCSGPRPKRRSRR